MAALIIMQPNINIPLYIVAIRDTVPDHVEQVLGRALAKAPADRFASMAVALGARGPSAAPGRLGRSSL